MVLKSYLEGCQHQFRGFSDDAGGLISDSYTCMMYYQTRATKVELGGPRRGILVSAQANYPRDRRAINFRASLHARKPSQAIRRTQLRMRSSYFSSTRLIANQHHDVHSRSSTYLLFSPPYFYSVCGTNRVLNSKPA
jgi:hypothetical protein